MQSASTGPLKTPPPPAGWQGESCSTPLLRKCTIRFRDSGNESVGHIDADGRDLNPLAEGYTESRCIGERAGGMGGATSTRWLRDTRSPAA